VKIADVLPVELKTLSAAQDSRITADLLEAFGDPLFDEANVMADEIREFGVSYPATARAVLHLYMAYRAERESVQNLATQVVTSGAEVDRPHATGFPTEEVSDLLQRHLNYFAELEEGAEALARDAKIGSDSLFTDLAAYLERVKGIQVRIEQAGTMRSAL